MAYVYAFLASGALCLLGQILITNTKVGFVRMFTLAVIVGAVLTAVGWMDSIIGFGFAGVIISVLDAGEAMFVGFTQALGGDFTSMLIPFLVMLSAIFLSAIVFGLLKKKDTQ